MNVQRFVPLLTCLVLFGCSPDVVERAEQLQNNVVAIAAEGKEGGQSGFGLITGQQGNSLYITTAEHVVAQANTIMVNFNNIGEAKPATIDFVDADNDVVVLTVNNPPRLTWYKNCLGSGQPGDDVGFIGRDGNWDITRGKEIGSIKDFGLNVINCYLPTVTVGTSGAPLVHDSGFIGMIVSDQSTATQAVDMNTISKLLQPEQSTYFLLENTGFSSGATETNPGLSILEKDVAAFTQADEKGTVEGYQAYLDQYRKGKFRKQALKRIEELKQNAERQLEDELWGKTKSQHTTEGYNNYLQEYEDQNGQYIQEAKTAIEALKAAAEKETAQQSKTLNPTVEKEASLSTTPRNAATILDNDGNNYRTKVMEDDKRWMTQNLNLKVENSWCYDNKSTNCTKYGRLYTWEAAKEACAELGNGWRLPTDNEWQNMAKKYGGAQDEANDKGKAAYQALIKGGSSGFAAQLGGWRYRNGYFYYAGTIGFYWSSSPGGSSDAWYYYFHRSSGQLYRYYYYRDDGHSVRCLQDP